MRADSPRVRSAAEDQASAAFFESPLEEPPSLLELPEPLEPEPEPESDEEPPESDELPSFPGCFDLRP